MRNAVGMLAALLAIGVATPSRADFIYKFSTDTLSGGLPDHGPFYAMLDVKDAAPMGPNGGGIDVSYHRDLPGSTIPQECDNMGGGCVIVSDPNFVSFYDAGGSYDPVYGHGSISIAFSRDRSIQGGSIVNDNLSDTLSMSAIPNGGGEWSGTDSADLGPCFSKCTFTGHWDLINHTILPSSVPEPASLALLGAGLLGLAAMRRRAA